MWDCPDCCHRFSREAAFRAHLRTHEPQTEKEEPPRKKRKYTKKKSIPEDTVVVSPAIKMYPCMLCSSLFGIESSLLSHLLTHSSEFPFGTEKDVVYASTMLVFLSSSKPF
jgi:uncharacterized Zn-finger protein